MVNCLITRGSMEKQKLNCMYEYVYMYVCTYTVGLYLCKHEIYNDLSLASLQASQAE